MQRIDLAVGLAVVKAEANAVHTAAFNFVGPQIRLRGQSIAENARAGHFDHGSHPLVVPIENRNAAVFGGRQRLGQFRLGLLNALDGAQPAQVAGTHVGDDAHVRAAKFTQARDFAGVVHAHLQDGPLVLVIQAEQGQGQALFIVQVAGRGERDKALLDDRRGQLFSTRLAYTARDADDAQIVARAVDALEAARILQPNLSVVYQIGDGRSGRGMGRQLGRQGPAPPGAVDQRRPLGRSLFPSVHFADNGAGASRQGCAHIGMTVGLLTRQRDKEIARLHVPAVQYRSTDGRGRQGHRRQFTS